MKKGRTGQSLIGTVAIYVVCIFLAVICILPFWIMVVNATRSTPEISGNRNFFDSNNAFI